MLLCNYDACLTFGRCLFLVSSYVFWLPLANVYPRLLDFVGTLITFKLIGGVYVSPFILQDLINILNHVDINDKP